MKGGYTTLLLRKDADSIIPVDVYRVNREFKILEKEGENEIFKLVGEFLCSQMIIFPSGSREKC